MSDLHLEEFLCSTTMVVAIFVILVAGFIGWYIHKTSEHDSELVKRLEQPATKISDWRAGWRCPTCRHWTGYSRKYLGPTVCKHCGAAASDYERVKYRAILRLDDNGIYAYDREIDMMPMTMKSGKCDYCGKKPCGCGATHNWLDVFEEVEA